MPDAITFATTSSAADVPTHTVYAKAKWSDDWVEQPHLYCTLCTWSLAPEIPTATLVWRYGTGYRPGDGAVQNVARKSLSRYYVRITFSHPGCATTNDWYGGIEIEGDNRGGSDVDGNGSGVQEFVCYGLERVLDVNTMRRTFWLDANNQLQVAGTALGFNDRGKKNMSSIAYSTSRAFDGGADSPDDLTGDYWTSRDAIKYLLFFDAPLPEDLEPYRGDPFSQAVEYQEPRVRFELDAVDASVVPEFDRPVLSRDGKRTLELLNSVMTRQRLLSYDLRVDGDVAYVHPCSFLSADLLLSAGEEPGNTHKGNRNLKTVSLTGDASASVVVQQSAVDVVDVITVRGAKRRSCFTVSKDDGTLAAGWTTAHQTEYNAGASTASSPAYPAAANIDERQRRNATAREADSLADVYARFVLPDNWGQTANNGQNSGSDNVVFPLGDGVLEASAYRAYPAQISILPTLPLLTHHDYSGTKIRDDTVTTAGDSPYDELPPLVLTPLLEDTDFFVHVENVGAANHSDYGGAGQHRNWSGVVTVEAESRAFRVEVAGAPQHTIAKTEFSPVDSSDWPVDHWDWRDFIATIAVEDDRYCEGHYPETLGNAQFPADVDAARTLVIDAGEGYRQDWVVAGTVVGVDGTDGTLIRTTTGGYVRDDRKPLKELARVAHEWYKDVRVAVEWSTSVYRPFRETVDGSEIGIRVGDMVTTLDTGDDQVAANTVVTSITIESPISADANPGVPKITYATQYADLDPVRFFAL